MWCIILSLLTVCASAVASNRAVLLVNGIKLPASEQPGTYCHYTTVYNYFDGENIDLTCVSWNHSCAGIVLDYELATGLNAMYESVLTPRSLRTILRTQHNGLRLTCKCVTSDGNDVDTILTFVMTKPLHITTMNIANSINTVIPPSSSDESTTFESLPESSRIMLDDVFYHSVKEVIQHMMPKSATIGNSVGIYTTMATRSELTDGEGTYVMAVVGCSLVGISFIAACMIISCIIRRKRFLQGLDHMNQLQNRSLPVPPKVAVARESATEYAYTYHNGEYSAIAEIPQRPTNVSNSMYYWL